jgi:hypothetical protein
VKRSLFEKISPSFPLVFRQLSLQTTAAGAKVCGLWLTQEQKAVWEFWVSIIDPAPLPLLQRPRGGDSMRRRQIEVIRYRRVTVIGRSDSELHSALFAESSFIGEKAREDAFAGERLEAQEHTRLQRLAISSQRLLNRVLRRRGHHSRKFSTTDRDRRRESS